MDIDSMISALCLVNRHEQCRGRVISLAYTGECQCSADCHYQVQDDLDHVHAGAEL